MEGSPNRKFIDGIYKSAPAQEILEPQKKNYLSKFLKIISIILIFGIFSFTIYKLFIPVSLIQAFPKIKTSVENTYQLSKLLSSAAGIKGEKNYLLLFQNPSEIRPGGGFLGDYGDIKIDSGKIKNISVNDIYEMKWEHNNGQNIDKPVYPPLTDISTPNYQVTESNWGADFPTNANRIQQFYSEYGFSNTDGVISVDPKIVEDILKTVGPVELPADGISLNESNFIDQIQYKVEVDNDFKRIGDHSVNPKKVLQDFAPIFISKIKNATLGQQLQIMKILITDLNEKHILLYSNNSQVEHLIQTNNWSGEIKNTDKDYLMVTDGNISGTKTSLKTIEDLKLSVNIFSDGSIINSVDVTHNGKNLSGGFLEIHDKSYVEIFTPLNSKLLSVQYDGSQIPLNQTYTFTEGGKTIFAFKGIDVYPGEIKKLTFQYKLPFTVQNSGDYSIYLQKQLNTNGKNLTLDINLPQNLKIKNSNQNDITVTPNSAEYLTNLATDKYLKLNFK
jgi:hypothetical protein